MLPSPCRLEDKLSANILDFYSDNRIQYYTIEASLVNTIILHALY